MAGGERLVHCQPLGGQNSVEMRTEISVFMQNSNTWEISLMKGDLYGLQTYETKETILLCPVNNTEYLNVAASSDSGG